MKTHYLIDADILAYKAAASCESKFDWDGVGTTTHADMNEAKKYVIEFLERITGNTPERVMGLHPILSDAVLCLSDPSKRYFRHDILPDYKAHRTSGEPPILLADIKQWFRTDPEFVVKEKPGLEADDVMGILSTWNGYRKGDRKIIVSEDKDMKTVPGDWKKDLYTSTTNLSLTKANYNWMTQTLTGDTCDGFKGCPGIGPVKAAKILDGLTELDDMWAEVVAAYEEKGLTEADALVQARCARILRAEDWDFERQKVKLWQPN